MKSENKNIAELVSDICRGLNLCLETNNKSSIKIFTDHCTGITLFIDFQKHNKFSFYFLQRTYDVVYNGDRSDIHVVFSLMFASFLRLAEQPNQISCSLFDIPHPVIDNEIWGRYIVPVQVPSISGTVSIEQRNEKILNLISLFAFWRYLFWKYAGCPCQECMKNLSTENTRGYQLSTEVLDAANKSFPSSYRVNYGSRLRPEIEYYYDMENEVTIIKSKELSLYLNTILNPETRNINQIKGIKGSLIIEGEIKNFVSKKTERKLKKVLNSLCGSEKKKVLFVPMENMIISQVNNYIVALGRLSGIDSFTKERERIRNRHNTESELLFPIPLFDWKENPCPDQFESLIRSLLEREPDVSSVQRAAPTNQADKGRDLIIKWRVQDESSLSQATPPISVIKVVGQCKASNFTVGKSKVLDVRDTVETHNSSGYFLAVSTQISAPLTEKLEQLETKGLWTKWWNRDDIEIRLSKNQDLIPLFPKVLTAKEKVKFIDK